jgi:hypothetical protein
MDMVRSALQDYRNYAWGIALGVVSLATAVLLETWFLGRLLGDPLPLALAPAALLRVLTEGFIYFDWRSPLAHLVFAISLGLISAWIVIRRDMPLDAAAQIGRLAGAVNVMAVAILEVDAVVVGFYYLISGYVSVMVISYTARRAAVWLNAQRPEAADRAMREAG